MPQDLLRQRFTVIPAELHDPRKRSRRHASAGVVDPPVCGEWPLLGHQRLSTGLKVPGKWGWRPLAPFGKGDETGCLPKGKPADFGGQVRRVRARQHISLAPAQTEPAGGRARRELP